MYFPYDAQIAASAFGGPVLLDALLQALPSLSATWTIVLCLLANATASAVTVLYFRRKRQITLRAAALGSTFGLGLTLILAQSFGQWRAFGCYLILFAFFHWSEYMSVAMCNPRSLSLDSFLLNHSAQYWLAAGASWIEYFIESQIVPSLKQFSLLSCLGLLLCIVGEILRKSAMFTARSSFTHLIAYRKKTSHQLITHGVYSLFRHPSYVGWFWWSIGTQLILANPICVCAYAYVSWHFFDSRIYEEEIMLINFYGEEYLQYQRSVPTGLPFISGFRGVA